jgi:hypothetical protein
VISRPGKFAGLMVAGLFPGRLRGENIALQRGQVVEDRSPDDVEINAEVPMGQSISHVVRGAGGEFRMSRNEVWIVQIDVPTGLANDLKFLIIASWSGVLRQKSA